MAKKMKYDGLKAFIDELIKDDELVLIDKKIDPNLEITEIADRVIKNPVINKALLFTNNGTNFPLLINLFGSEERMAKVLRISKLDDARYLFDSYLSVLTGKKKGLLSAFRLLKKLLFLKSILPVQVKMRNPKCQQVIQTQPDISKLPVLKCWPYDGGKFITLPLVHTIHVESGVRNLGMYRMQIFGKQEIAMHWHRHKGGAAHFNSYKQAKKKMPVAVTLGGDPIYTYAATAPLPDNIDEYLLAGFLRKRKVKLVKCITQDIYVPEDSDFVIEGYIDTEENFVREGPFGDHTGFYSLEDYYPLMHITCITHRNDAVYPATIVGIPPMEDALIAKATEKIFFSPIKMTLAPEITDMHLPAEGVAHNLALVKIKKQYPGQAIKVMNALWGAGQMMFNKILVVISEDVELSDYTQVLKTILRNTNPQKDFYVHKGPLDELDHSASKPVFGGKLFIDASVKLPEEESVDYKGFDLHNFQNINIAHPIVKYADASFFKENIPVLFLYVDEKKLEEIHLFIAEITDKNILPPKLFIVIVDENVPYGDLGKTAWYFFSNFDPVRDFYREISNHKSLFVFDGTNKYCRKNYQRKWPNIVCMDDNTIQKINSIWNELNLGENISSPSLLLKPLMKNDDAVCKI